MNNIKSSSANVSESNRIL